MYWGKIIGTLAGAATLKPWFVILGLLVGHQFDRGFAARYRDFESQGKSSARLPEEFIKPLFQAMGHLAKSNGRVSEDEIRAARGIMHRLSLSPANVRNAMHWFDDGKRADFPLRSVMQQTRKKAARNPELRLLFMRLVMEVVLSNDSISRHERALLWTMCQEFEIGRVDLAQLEAMLRAQKGFRQSPEGNADAARVQQAYATLGVDTNASNEDIKKAYRRQMSRNHPDKIAADNPGADEVAAAGQRTKDIRAAYEMLKARRSIR